MRTRKLIDGGASDLEAQLLENGAQEDDVMGNGSSVHEDASIASSMGEEARSRKASTSTDKKDPHRRRRRWLHRITKDKNSPLPVEITFQIMQNRKVMRKKWGTYESDKPWTMLWVFLTLLLMFGVAGASFVNGHFSIKLNTGQVGFWSLVTVVTFAILIYTLTRVMVVFRWMLYWLLLAEVLNLMLHKEYNLFSDKTPIWLIACLSAAEIVTILIYFMFQYVYPSVLGSDWFRKTIGAKTWWEVRSLGPWTLTYASGFSTRNTCAYRGETNEKGLPHGYGHWMDDSYHGEILTGWWENGKPVGPFRSREYGSGFAFDKLMIAFVMATDDECDGYKLIPSNNNPPRCGVASVECSVSGAFFAHLPDSQVMFGPYELNVESDVTPRIGAPSPRLLYQENVDRHRTNATIADCLARVRHLSTAHPLSNIQITAKYGRGVSVAGHICSDNGKSTSKRCRQLVIDVVYPPTATEEDRRKVNGNGVPLSCQRNVSSGNFSACSSSAAEEAALELMMTPALRSSMQFADFTHSAEIDEDDEMLLMSAYDHENGTIFENDGEMDSDLESVEYDSGSFNYEPFSLSQSVTDVPPSSQEQQVSNELEQQQSGEQQQQQQQQQENQQTEEDESKRVHAMRHNVSSASFATEEKERILMMNRDKFESVPHLRVRGWRSTMDGHTEALIFIPGFNASLNCGLQRLGQFLAMGRLPSYIKPIIFVWPAGKIVTYLKAMRAAANDKTSEVFGMMLDGLYDAGIRDVHIMTHSMGVQALMGAFKDKPSGERSDVSKRFSLAPDFAEVSVTSDDSLFHGSFHDTDEENGEHGRKLLRCRTITLLNPDYPLAAFVDHGFGTLRRICDHITVVGNRKDMALFWSEMGNGAMQTIYHYFGGQTYPDHLLVPIEDPDISGPRDPDSYCPASCACCFRKPDAHEIDKHMGQDRLWSKQLTVGKQIFSLFAPPEPASQQQEHHHHTSLFLRAPNVLFQRIKHVPRRRRRQPLPPRRNWLDLDAIDTTWMETNVHALRHNYFNLNPVMVDDLHELIVTGRRAADRSTLLHREGNIYSYCQAPACVVNDS